MICPNEKCKAKLPDDYGFCFRCGKIFDLSKFYYNKIDMSYFERRNELLKSYMGTKKISMRISLSYLFFNWMYLFIKNLYISSLMNYISLNILILTSFIFINLPPLVFGFSFIPSICIIYSCIYITIYYVFNTNNIYLEHSRKKVLKIMMTNKDKTFEELKLVCRKAGKTNCKLLFLLFLIIIATMLAYLFFYKQFDLNSIL